MKEVTNYLNNKLDQDENLVRITFYEIRIKYNLSEEETETFLELAKNKFENTGYNVFFTGDTYEYENMPKVVQTNELMVAVKK